MVDPMQKTIRLPLQKTGGLRHDVRFGSKTALKAPQHDFRFTPNNGHLQASPAGPVCARLGDRPDYSITSSARADSAPGTSIPTALAVFRLMTNSNFVIGKTGSSLGFSPLKDAPGVDSDLAVGVGQASQLPERRSEDSMGGIASAAATDTLESSVLRGKFKAYSSRCSLRYEAH
jgi:hypothetical protein